jgi:hypothetical protein
VKFAFACLLSVAAGLAAALADDKPPEAIYRLPREAIESLSKGTDFVIFSLDPGPAKSGPRPKLKPEENLDGFKILGRLALDDERTRSQVLDAVNDSIHNADYRLIDACFLPGQALRVSFHERVFDFLISYPCGQIRLYEKGAIIGIIGIPTTPDTLREILSNAEIPLAPQTRTR